MVEQGTHKPLVVGSTPTLGTCIHEVGTKSPMCAPLWDLKRVYSPSKSASERTFCTLDAGSNSKQILMEEKDPAP